MVAHPAVEEAVALAIPDDEIGNTIRAIVTFNDRSSVTSPELKRHCAEKLPPYMIPEEIEFRDSLPRTGNGKIDRQRLQREIFAPSIAFSRNQETPQRHKNNS